MHFWTISSAFVGVCWSQRLVPWNSAKWKRPSCVMCIDVFQPLPRSQPLSKSSNTDIKTNLLQWYSVGFLFWRATKCWQGGIQNDACSIYWGFNLAVHVMPQNLSLVVYVSAGGCYQTIQLRGCSKNGLLTDDFLHNPELHQLRRILHVFKIASRLICNDFVTRIALYIYISYSLKLDDLWHSAALRATQVTVKPSMGVSNMVEQRSQLTFSLQWLEGIVEFLKDSLQ